MGKILITEQNLTVKQIAAVCWEHAVMELSSGNKEAVLASRRIVDDLVAERKVVYGITTGFGKFSGAVISTDGCHELQKNLIIAHTIGAGDPFPEDVTRGMLLLRVSNLSKGYSGIRLETLETMIAMLNEGVIPFILEKGSLGASGNLAPLSHMVLAMLGPGKAYYRGELLSGAKVMKRVDISVVRLSAKGGLALNNGTRVMTSAGAFALHNVAQLLKTAGIADTFCSEAQNDVMGTLEDKIHVVRPREDQGGTAKNLRRLLADSKNTTRRGEVRVQGAYSLRCSPQIYGVPKDAVKYVQGRVDIKINLVTDNLLIFKEDRVGIPGGNPHSQSMALPFDLLKIAEAELTNVSERRIEGLVDPAYLALPTFLTPHGGVCSGFMIAQYLAAALVLGNKALTHPASVDSILNSTSQKDHASIGTIAAYQTTEISKNVRRVLAMELIVAYQGIDMHGNKGLGRGMQVTYNLVRKGCAYLDDNRELYEDVNYCERVLMDSPLIRAVEAAIGGELEV